MTEALTYEFPDFLTTSSTLMQDTLEGLTLDEEIKQAIMSLDDESSPLDSSTTTFSQINSPATLATEYPEEETPNKINMNTIASIKQAMVDTSKLLGLYTTLKVTYMKLCKEFNYLLTKFNENERIKIELIHENNELKKLLYDLIKEREVEKRKKRKV
ncbi:Protein ATC1/LIC4 [Spathaspora sp. JA1]|nr:Protein ATC1/LIC4 [Spathaspora sp. JA1]